MTYQGTQAAIALDALGDSTRRAVFERLSERPRSVGELAQELPVSRPAVSQHLRVLKDAGLVTDRAAGNRRIYRIDPTGLGGLSAYLDEFWTRALSSFKAAAERERKGIRMTTANAAETAAHASVLVEAPVERAFSVFTEDIGSWWPPDHHILQAELAGMVFEPRVGGHLYDRGVDGSECRWARVLVYEPPLRVVFSWDIDARWQIETDPARTSEVEVRFTAQGPGRTLVELEHRKLDRHGEGWETVRDAVGSPGGWTRGLEAFAARLAG